MRNGWSRQVSWNAHEADFKEAVEALSNVEEVEVTKNTWTDATGFDYYHWTVSAFCLTSTGGLAQEVFEVSRVGLGRARSGQVGPGRVG